MHLNSSSTKHVGRAESKSGLVCLSLLYFLPFSGPNLGPNSSQERMKSAEVSSCHSFIKKNLEENSSQQPPGMCGGGGWISGLVSFFSYKVLAGFRFGNLTFK